MSRRTVARVALAGAIVAIPLTALAIPASAVAGPDVTDVRHDRWDCDRPDFFDNWNHSPGRWNDCDRWNNPSWDDPWHGPHHVFPRGSFGSS